MGQIVGGLASKHLLLLTPSLQTSIKYLKVPSRLAIFLLFALMLIAFLARLVNLNYNVPFNDEAIYIVIGRLGLFNHDWWTYNAVAWMAGLPYLYPVMAALSSMTGGVVGSRVLNVVFGVLAIESLYVITTTIFNISDVRKYLAGLIAAAILAFSSVSFYVSRLATYDMPSFYLLFLSLALLLLAQRPTEHNGKLYFFSALTLIFAFTTKIIVGIYFPLIFLYSYLMAKKSPGRYLYWLRYYVAILGLFFLIFFVLNFGNLVTYYHLQADIESTTPIQILEEVWQNSYLNLALWILSAVGLLFTKDKKIWLVFSALALLIPLFHIITHRSSTLDKHVYLSLGFLAIATGWGLSNLVYFLVQKLSFWRYPIYLILLITLTFWGMNSYFDSLRFNNLWINNQVITDKLKEIEHPGDKVLTESGAAVILATYDKNFPTNTTTFDYLKYQQFEGDQAYKLALADGYFDLVELENENVDKTDSENQLHNLIMGSIKENYNLAYQDSYFTIYKRKF